MMKYVWVKFFSFENWECVCLHRDNERCYSILDMIYGFSSSNRSKTTLKEVLIVGVRCCTGGEEDGLEFFTFENWECFCFHRHNERGHSILEMIYGFSSSNRSKNHVERSSNCRCEL